MGNPREHKEKLTSEPNRSLENVDLNLRNEAEDTPLFFACATGEHKIVAYLLEAGADYHLLSRGRNILDIAVQYKQHQVINLLLKHDPIYFRDRVEAHGIPPLYLAAQNGDEKAIKILLAFGANSNVVTADGLTPLAVAAFNGDKKMVELLLGANDININQTVAAGSTALMIAIEKGHIEIVKLLLAQPKIKINYTADKQHTPLIVALTYGHEEIAELLWEKAKAQGSEAVNQVIDSLRTHNTTGQYQHLIDSLLSDAQVEQKKAPVFGEEKRGGKPLAENADLDLRNKKGETPLFYYCAAGDHKKVEFLLEAGADYHLLTGDLNILDIAVNYKHHQVIRSLLKYDPIYFRDRIESHGIPPLYLAAQNGDKETVEILLEFGADSKVVNSDGITPLVVSVFNGNKEIAALLIQSKNININQTTPSDKTALMIAVEQGHTEIVKMLLDHPEINVNYTNSSSQTAFIIALENNEEIAELLWEKIVAQGEEAIQQTIRSLAAPNMAGRYKDLISSLSRNENQAEEKKQEKLVDGSNTVILDNVEWKATAAVLPSDNQPAVLSDSKRERVLDSSSIRPPDSKNKLAIDYDNKYLRDAYTKEIKEPAEFVQMWASLPENSSIILLLKNRQDEEWNEIFKKTTSEQKKEILRNIKSTSELANSLKKFPELSAFADEKCLSNNIKTANDLALVLHSLPAEKQIGLLDKVIKYQSITRIAEKAAGVICIINAMASKDNIKHFLKCFGTHLDTIIPAKQLVNVKRAIPADLFAQFFSHRLTPIASSTTQAVTLLAAAKKESSPGLNYQATTPVPPPNARGQRKIAPEPGAGYRVHSTPKAVWSAVPAVTTEHKADEGVTLKRKT